MYRLVDSRIRIDCHVNTDLIDSRTVDEIRVAFYEGDWTSAAQSSSQLWSNDDSVAAPQQAESPPSTPERSSRWAAGNTRDSPFMQTTSSNQSIHSTNILVGFVTMVAPQIIQFFFQMIKRCPISPGRLFNSMGHSLTWTEEEVGILPLP